MTAPVYPPAHTRIQFTGELQQITGASEIFDFGFADASGLGVEAASAAGASAVRAYWGSQASDISSRAYILGCRAEEVLATGKVGSSYFTSVPRTAGLSDGANWTILSLCVTLETDTPDAHGRTVRGRFYPPAYPNGYGSTLALADVQAYGQSWAAFLTMCVTAGLTPAVASVTMGGQIANVVGVTTATVIDTQRKRKNSITPQRTTVFPL